MTVTQGDKKSGSPLLLLSPLLSQHHAYAHACSRMPIAPSAQPCHLPEEKEYSAADTTADAPESGWYFPGEQEAHVLAPARPRVVRISPGAHLPGRPTRTAAAAIVKCYCMFRA